MARGARTVALVALGAAAGFAWGALVFARHVFPYTQLEALRARFGSDGPDGDPPAVSRVATGWYEAVRRPSTDEVLAGLDELGYLDSYEAAGEEVGVVLHDRERAASGVNLVVSAHAPEAFLADLDGEVLHRWSFDFDELAKPAGYVPPPSEFGERYFRRARLLDDGGLLALYERTGLVKLDRDSRLQWGLTGLFHHDLDVAADGAIHVLTHEVHVVPRIHPTRDTFEDFVTHVSPDGAVLGRFSLLEAFERSDYAPLVARAPDREDIFHTNTLTLLDGSLAHVSPHFGAGKALISVWGLDAVAVVDLESERVEWALCGPWHRQHEPVLTARPSLLVFDNLGLGDYSRVVEVDPFTQETLWSFAGDAGNDFSSKVLGSVQRLSNGNTLVTESTAGRAFELTPSNEVVWSWSSPYRAGPNGEGVAVLVEVVRLDRPAWLER
jgi:hypothetical protein